MWWISQHCIEMWWITLKCDELQSGLIGELRQCDCGEIQDCYTLDMHCWLLYHTLHVAHILCATTRIVVAHLAWRRPEISCHWLVAVGAIQENNCTDHIIYDSLIIHLFNRTTAHIILLPTPLTFIEVSHKTLQPLTRSQCAKIIQNSWLHSNRNLGKQRFISPLWVMVTSLHRYSGYKLNLSSHWHSVTKTQAPCKPSP